jgi:hypothetical protein
MDDMRAAAVPLLCAAHCLAAPLLLVVAPSLAEAPALETGLILAGAGVALPLTVRGVRLHGAGRVWAPVVLGLLLWAVKLLGLEVGVGESVLAVAGSVAVATGLLWNARLRQRVECCDGGCDVGG